MTSSAVHDVDGNLITCDMLYYGYTLGCFPMSASRGEPFAWYKSNERAIVTWDQVRCPRSLKKVMAHKPYRIEFDHDFSAVMNACAERDETWIGHGIQQLFEELFQRGFAHCVGAYDSHDSLVGGCYGLALGDIFCGESMFHRAPDASKICVWKLMQCLQAAGFYGLDCQQQSDHMARFGAYEIDDREYQELLDRHVRGKPPRTLY